MLFAVLVVAALIRGPTVPLTGTVVTDDGTPVVGAELVLTDPTPGQSPVVARGKTGEGGAFTFDRPAGLGPTDVYLAPTLWVVAPGRVVAVVKFAGAVPGADEPVRVVMGPAARTEVRVEAPDGTPVAGAKLRVQRIRPEPMSLPEAVCDLTERTTGPDGVGLLDSFRPEDVGSVDVVARGYGNQPRWFDPALPGPKRTRLLPVAALKGRLVPEAGAAGVAGGWHVRAWTALTGAEPGTNRMAGYGEATTDGEGRFAIPEIAPGALTLSVSHPDGPELLPEVPKSATVRAGAENVVEVPLRRASTLTGRVVEHGGGKPVVGMRVHLFQGNGADTKTDEQGRYTFRCVPGKVSVWAPKAPPGYVSTPGLNRHEIEVPAAPGRVDLGATEILRAAPPLKGEVRDESGRPVAGAVVGAQWLAATPIGTASGTTAATADERGGFALSGLAPGARLTLTARRRDRATAAPVSAVAGSEATVTLTVVPRATVAVAGRVLGPDGVPVEGARVILRSRETKETSPNPFGAPVALEGNAPVLTGKDGTFQTPKELDREGREYQAEVTAEGYLPGKSAWAPTGEDGVLTLPEMTLRETPGFRVVTGRVVDRGGGPVSGAKVFQAGDGPRRTDATADGDGRFRLAGVYAGPALVFAEKDGFRFGGAVVGPGPGGVEVKLARESEAPAADLKTLPSPLGRAEERALARELLAPVLAEARAGTLGSYATRAVPALARVDPDRALAMIEERVIAPSTALVPIALARLEDDPGAAAAVVEADSDPGSRARAFLALAASDRGRRVEWLGRALDEARRVREPGTKVNLLGLVADRWLDLGDLDRAKPVIREGKAVVDATPKDDYHNFYFQFEEFGEVLAVIDLPAARALFEREGATRINAPDRQSVQRHLAGAAVRVAAFDPAEALRLAAGGSGGPNIGDREDLNFRVARNMARADLPRARALLRTIADSPENPTFARPALVPYGLGLMASELAATDPAAARGLLDEAFAGLLKLGRGADGRPRPVASILMAALLPVVERIDPGRVAERAWLAASCRPPYGGRPEGSAVTDMLTLALLLSRYDRAAAEAVSAPAVECLPALIGGMDRPGQFDARTYDVLAAYDPRAIASLIRSLPPSARKRERSDDGNPGFSADLAARLSAAEMLGRPIAERRRAALERSAYFYRMAPERP